MEKRIKEYLAKMDGLLAELKTGGKPGNIDDILGEHIQQIGFFAHERLIHLIVTALFAVLEMLALFMAVSTGNIAAVVLSVAILILLVPYVRHYYILENSVQKMWMICKKCIRMRGFMRPQFNPFLTICQN